MGLAEGSSAGAQAHSLPAQTALAQTTPVAASMSNTAKQTSRKTASKKTANTSAQAKKEAVSLSTPTVGISPLISALDAPEGNNSWNDLTSFYE